MIVIATSGDRVKDVLHGYARAFVASLDVPYMFLGAGEAEAVAIDAVLAAHPGVKAFLFGHGADPPAIGFVADCGNIVLDPTGIAKFLPGRTIAGSCCHGEGIGAHAGAARFEMFGYLGKLAVPKWERYASLMEGAVLEGPRWIARGETAAAAARAATIAYDDLAHRLNDSGEWEDFLAAATILLNHPTSW